jgi:hypothetical protein
MAPPESTHAGRETVRTNGGGDGIVDKMKQTVDNLT